MNDPLWWGYLQKIYLDAPRYAEYVLVDHNLRKLKWLGSCLYNLYKNNISKDVEMFCRDYIFVPLEMKALSFLEILIGVVMMGTRVSLVNSTIEVALSRI